MNDKALGERELNGWALGARCTELVNLPWFLRLADSGSDSDSNLLINFGLASGIHCVAADRTSLLSMTH